MRNESLTHVHEHRPVVELTPEARARLHTLTAIARATRKASAAEVVGMAEWVLSGAEDIFLSQLDRAAEAAPEDAEQTEGVIDDLYAMLGNNDPEPGLVKSVTDLMNLKQGLLIENDSGQVAVRIPGDPFCFQIVNPDENQPIKSLTAGELLGYMPGPYRIIPGTPDTYEPA